ncbi:MAG: HAMP domain-containing protein [Armatimonadetes bacterium]|nr:HAMP domain-containing protein [Armatimonadota bacterium]
MHLASIRTRLVIQNIGVMAVALILLGFLTYYIAAGSQMRAFDHDLERRSQRFVDDHRRPPPQGEEGMRPPPPPPNSHQPFRGVLLDLQKQPLTQDSASVYAPNDIQLGLDGEQVYSNIMEGEVPLRVITHPIMQSGRVIGVAQHAAPLDEVFRVQSELANTLIILFPISMGIISIAVNSLVKRSLRPVRNISRTADKMGSQDLALRLPIYGNDEFAELSTTLNGLLARLQNAFQRQEEVLEQQRQFVADASHELRTPLTVIKANADLYQKGERTTESYRSALGVIGRSANTMNRLVQDLLLLA